MTPSAERPRITVTATIHAPLEKVWDAYTTPVSIIEWNQASPDWHTPRAENDLRTGGTFTYRMEAKDGSFGFDFAGIYDEVRPHEYFSYAMEDGRKVETYFVAEDDAVTVTVTFDAEGENPLDMQRTGWQAILDSFKKYAEA